MERLADFIVPVMLLAPIAIKTVHSLARRLGAVEAAQKIESFMRTVSWYTRLS